MKNKFKISDKYLSSLPPEYLDGLDDELKQAEVEPFIMRRGYEGLMIGEGDSRCSIAQMTTRDIDADNEIILPWGLSMDRYHRNPIVLWGHKWSDPPIGSCDQVQIDSYGIKGRINFASTPRADEIWSLVRDKHLRTNSIGFFVLDYVSRSHKDFGVMIDKAMNEWGEFNQQHADRLKGFVRRGILVENSIVTVPSNASAVMQAVAAKQLSLSDDVIRLMGIESLDEVEADEVEAADPPTVVDTVEIPPAVVTTEEEVENVKLVCRLVRRAADHKVDPSKIAADIIDLRFGRV